MKAVSENVALPHLLRLLDDEQPEVRNVVHSQLANYDGDLSNEVAGLGIDLSEKDRSVLSRLLMSGRRRSLRAQWFAPPAALCSPDGDWDLFEAFLRMLSDYLHDGVSLRPSLSDLLDELADESAERHIDDPIPLANWLFDNNKFKANRDDYYNPSNSDLAEVIMRGEGIPLSLSLVFILVAQRRQIPVFGCNYPGHFLCWTDTSSGPLVIDPYNQARTLAVKNVLATNANISSSKLNALQSPARQIDMLRRIIANLNHAFVKQNAPDDAALMDELSESLDEVELANI